MPSLKWVVPEGRPRVFGVFKKATSIGYARSNDIVLDDSSVAPFHAQLVFDGRDFTLSSLDSDATVRVNGKRRRRGKLFHNDRLEVGEAELVFSVFDEGAEPERAPDTGGEIAGMVKLSDLTRRLLELRTVPEQIDALLDAVIELTAAKKGFIVLLDDGEPYVATARNVAREQLDAGVADLSDTILQRCVETRQPLLVSDAQHDPMFEASASVMKLELSSVMVSPLIARGRLLGVLYLGNDDVVNLFESAHLDLLTVVAGQASLVLHSALLLNEVQRGRDRMAEALGTRSFGDLIGSHPSLVEIERRIEKVAPTDISVLVTGETGTGKELVARELHRRSKRSEGPFVVVNCGAIPDNLLESELFGHVRGAFTGATATRVGRFQLANGGTLFLDEIGEMPLALQVKLLRALQERTVTKVGGGKPEAVDIRVVAATHRDLDAEIRAGRFREDLYYRLHVVNLDLPPLRDRGDDVVVLAKYLLAKHANELQVNVRGLTPSAIAALRAYPWPGNVRELDNRIRRALVLADGPLLDARDIELSDAERLDAMPLGQARDEFTRRYVLAALERNGGNRAETARELDVDPRTIYRYLEREPDERAPSSA
ncbi:MAG: sigma 54-interacting transcriptional regulator [Myxococcales bacterium]|nr:sigma 54-interacting transcriptional regulator [Myxococcales bacterium]